MSGPRFELLVGAPAFWARAAADIAAARHRVFVQAMTFEADAAGAAVGAAVAASGAADRRVLVDDYSRHVINDTFVNPRAPAAVQAEATATRAMFDGLVADGVGVRVTNPIGRNRARYMVRNHKKLIVADDIAYIGGINFSDHNFAWHDMMIRIGDAGPVAMLAEDFAATWASRPVARRAAFDGLVLHALDGRTNAAQFRPVFAAIAAARTAIDVVSAYPTEPFLGALAAAARRGCRVRIFTPMPNNKPVVRDALVPFAARAGIEVRLLPDMTHLKAILIDGTTLFAGSTNFDFASFHVEEEYLAIIDDPALVEQFRARVLVPAEQAALPDGSWTPARWRGIASRAALALASGVVRTMRGTKRSAVDWE